MKRNLLLTSLFVFAFAGLFAQRVANPKAVQMAKQKALPAVKTAYTGLETTNGQMAESVPPASNSSLDVVGNTVYDLQSNGGVGHRVFNHGGGDVTGTFTMALNASGYPDRGTGYNTRTGGAWGAPPATRVESIRTGFTNLVVAPNGNQYVFTHSGPLHIHMSKKVGAGPWTESDIPSSTLQLWARAAGGGADGNSLHVIASSAPTGNGGTLFQGMNGVVQYFRSQDGGATWDIKDALLPGIDSTTFVGTDVEGYAIDANGENVSIVTTNSWNDCLVYISHDNGTTWEKRVLNEFPLDKYVINSGYDTLSIPADPNRPSTDPYAIFTADGTVDILVDDNGITHVWYGATYVSDADLTDTGWTFYPGTNIGIVYWNDLMDDNAGVISGYCPDINNNQVLDVTDLSNYGIGLSSFPAGSIDANGNLYVTYTTAHELYLDANSNFNFRQPFIVASQDNGATWTDPVPVMDSLLLGEGDFTDVPYLEAVYNSCAKLADDKVHITFQADYAPLTFLNNPETDTESGDNSIRYVGYPTAWLLGSSTKNVPSEALNLSVTPNPANDRITIQFNSDRTQTSWVEMYDIYGKTVRSTEHVTVGNGTGAVNISTADLPTGMYVARVNLGNSYATQKVVVKH